MILASHIIVSGLVGSAAKNYFAAAFFGFTSHYILDTLPHWDYSIDDFSPESPSGLFKTKNAWRNIAKLATDVAGGIIVLLILLNRIYQNNIENIAPVFIGAVFGVLPDALQLLYWKTKTPYLKWLSDIHAFTHSIFNKTKKTALPGLAYQIITIALVFIALKFF